MNVHGFLEVCMILNDMMNDLEKIMGKDISYRKDMLGL
jgi:hypothetical protein